MPCPYAGRGPSTRGSRRGFLKSALAVGGSTMLSACVERGGDPSVARGPAEPATPPERQFAWNEFLPTGPHGNVKVPNYQLLLFLDYARDGQPTAADRDRAAAAFDGLDRLYQWGTGDEYDPVSTHGLLSMVGYSPSYFARFDRPSPAGVGLQGPREVLAALGEDERRADDFDAFVLLSSDDVRVLLTAEQALFGRLDEVNGVPVAGSIEGTFDVVDRRTGFIGVGLPADTLDVEDVPEHSPTAMGYRSGFSDNQASEDRVALPDGPFADGTTAQVSQLRLGLERWYDLDESRRVDRMFSPRHTVEEVGDIGENLGGQSRIRREAVDRTPADAAKYGVVGHTQKVAAARDESFRPVILRRSEGTSLDTGDPGMNFLSVQRDVADFVRTRRAMNGDLFEDDLDVEPEQDGILDHVSVRSRGTYLVPPRSKRALPTPEGDVPT